MTPCEILGYKVGDKFIGVDNSRYNNVIATLVKDDGTNIPLFIIRGKYEAEYISLDRLIPLIPRTSSSCPDHYDSEIQPKDFMESSFTSEEYQGAMKWNIIKYVSRYKQKDGIKDLKKAIDYLNWLIEHEER